MTNPRRKICVVTGSRADYGVVYPVLRVLRDSMKIELSVIATAMHLAPEFGLTVREIEKAGFPIDARVDMLLGADTNAAMAKSIGIGVQGMAQALESIRPAIVLLPVDRAEHLAAAVAAATMNILIAHMNGGDVSGSIDESYRHAISKFAHVHFPNCRSSADRLLRMGERPDRVHCVGDASLDNLFLEELPSGPAVRKKYALKEKEDFIIAVFHPVSTESESASDQMKVFLAAVVASGMRTIFLSSNADAGGRGMVELLKRERKTASKIDYHTTLPHADYLALLREARALAGNSSSGILEAPSVGLPVVNVGTRQQGRERAGNVIDVPFEPGLPGINAITDALKKALHDEDFRGLARTCRSPYGDGHAAEKIVSILEDPALLVTDVQKTFHDERSM
ncbi:MAG: UDP-N-acetylglucosamine 2-epimerase [Candidatus Hydrogenedentota bacterium]